MTKVKNKTIYSRLIDFQSMMPIIKKNANNPFYKSEYASFDHIQAEIREALKKAELGYYQLPTTEGLVTVLFDIDGNELTSPPYPAVFEGKPQVIGSSVSYAKRYSLTAILGLIIEGEDDDGNATVDAGSSSYSKKKKTIIDAQDISNEFKAEYKKAKESNNYSEKMKVMRKYFGEGAKWEKINNQYKIVIYK